MPDRQYDIITFDCYGTLVDWESAVEHEFMRRAAADGVRLDSRRLMSECLSAETEFSTHPYRSYRDVLAQTVAQVAERLGWSLNGADGGFLADSLSRWMPFPDTNASLERLRAAGYRLGILSNIDRDLLAITMRNLTVDFDLIVTADEVRSYKPGSAHFAAARSCITGERWIHAAQSYSADIVPARALGIPVAWINRKQLQAPDSEAVAFQFESLADFTSWMTGS